MENLAGRSTTWIDHSERFKLSERRGIRQVVIHLPVVCLCGLAFALSAGSSLSSLSLSLSLTISLSCAKNFYLTAESMKLVFSHSSAVGLFDSKKMLWIMDAWLEWVFFEFGRLHHPSSHREKPLILARDNEETRDCGFIWLIGSFSGKTTMFLLTMLKTQKERTWL